MSAPPGEHPFAPYVRALGRGRTGARSLDATEAQGAMGMILDGKATPEQTGAFLMLLRVKEETPAELAGFVRAARERLRMPQSLQADLDWPSYAGKRQHHPWFLLAARLLAANGHRVLMHGCEAHDRGRLFTIDALRQLDMASARNADDAARLLDATGFAFLPVAAVQPRLQELLALRFTLGLRSPVNTFIRHLNPAGARASLLSLHHPAYAALHADALAQLQGGTAVIFRGDGGECELRPDAETRCLMALADGSAEFTWPRAFAGRGEKPERADTAPLRALWDGSRADAYGEQAVVQTAAVALLALGAAPDPLAAVAQATTLWRARPAWNARP